jgi:hypothetical protein
MATRFYFQSGTTPTVSPAFSASWDSTTGMVRLKMDTEKRSTAFLEYSNSQNPFSGSYAGVAQLVSRPLDGAQTITASGWRPPIVRVRNNGGNQGKELAFVARVCSNDGSTFRGTLLAFTFSNGSDFQASPISLAPAQQSMSAVSAQDGDRIVIEIGFRNNTTGAGTNSVELGDASSSDLGTTAGEANPYNPWTEFVSLDLTFQSEGNSLTKTVSNSLNLLGLSPSTYWGATYNMLWGSSKWGEGTRDLQVSFTKVLSNSITPSDTYTKSVSKLLSEQITGTWEGVTQYLTDAAGYYWLFPGSVRDADDRVTATYTEASQASTTWTSATVTSTTWS